MSRTDLIVHHAEFRKLEECLERLRFDADARAIFLIDRNGQQIAASGEVGEYDSTSLASLTAGNVAATDGLAKLIGEREFSVLFHEGERDHIHISVVAGRAILVVIFDERSSLGLVRLQVKRASAEMQELFAGIEAARSGAAAAASASPFSEITDEDIDALFSE